MMFMSSNYNPINTYSCLEKEFEGFAIIHWFPTVTTLKKIRKAFSNTICASEAYANHVYNCFLQQSCVSPWLLECYTWHHTYTPQQKKKHLVKICLPPTKLHWLLLEWVEIYMTAVNDWYHESIGNWSIGYFWGFGDGRLCFS